MEADLAFHAVLLPAVAAAALAWLACMVARRGGPVAVPARVAAVVTSVAPLAWSLAYQEDSIRAVLRPATAYPWLGWASVMAATVCAVVSTQPGLRAAIAAGSIASLASCIMVNPPDLDGAGPNAAAAVLSMLATVGMAVALGHGRPGQRSLPCWPALAAWWAVFAAASGMVLLSGFAKLAVACGALSASAAAWAAMTAFVPRLAVLAPAASGAFAATLGVTMLVARGYDESGFPSWCWWAMTAAPGAACVAAWPGIARRPRLRALATVMAPALVALAALAAARAATGDGAGPSAPVDYALARSAGRGAP